MKFITAYEKYRMFECLECPSGEFPESDDNDWEEVKDDDWYLDEDDTSDEGSGTCTKHLYVWDV